MRRPAFTLIETLVVVAVIAVLVAIAVPALSAARESARSTACLTNLRSIVTIALAYADEHKGFGPALGQPYGSLPNWAFVVQQSAGNPGSTSAEVFTPRSALVCPTINARLGRQMTRTYAANATGQAGLPASPPQRPAPDAGDFDNPDRPAHPRYGLVTFPDRTPAFLDSAAAPPGPGQPPPTRTASVLDFRQPAHVAERIGLFHNSGRALNLGFVDGSARPAPGPPAASPWPPADWLAPLP